MGGRIVVVKRSESRCGNRGNRVNRSGKGNKRIVEQMAEC